MSELTRTWRPVCVSRPYILLWVWDITTSSTCYFLHPKLDPNLGNDWGETALHIAMKYGNVNIFKLLLSNAKTDPNIMTEAREPILHLAAENGDERFIEPLLTDARTNLRLKHKDDNTALHAAVEAGRHNAVKMILKSDWTLIHSVNDAGFTPVQTALQHGHFSLYLDLLALQSTMKMMYWIDSTCSLSENHDEEEFAQGPPSTSDTIQKSKDE